MLCKFAIAIFVCFVKMFFLLMLLLLWQRDSSQVPFACQPKEGSTRYRNVTREPRLLLQ